MKETEKPKNAIETMAGRLQVSREVLQTTLKSTAFAECKTNEQFIACVLVSNAYRLNPFLKEIYAFPSKGGIIPIVSIDGWIRIAKDHPDYDGVELIENKGEKGKVESVTVKFYLKGISHPVVITEYMTECARDTEPWKKWPIRMLRHKAYIQGARVAFGFSGIYDEDEAARIVEAQETTITPDIAGPITMPLPKKKEPAPVEETVVVPEPEEVREPGSDDV